ncbi:MAG: ferrous iron transport protein B [Planctomycetota bacterium]|nr:ferrous iron transport protein B [Planctomycetota bacterium]
MSNPNEGLSLIALAGNPNTGKTSLFNRLTDTHERVGNYPGITVDRHTGHFELPEAGMVEVLDIPGNYSLSARSAEEQIAIGALSGLPPYPVPDVVVLVVDATQLTRNLYLALQVIELEQPAVVALNMVDMLDGEGREVDPQALEKALGVPVIATNARDGKGLDQLKAAIDRILAQPKKGTPGARWAHEDPLLQADLQAIHRALPESWKDGRTDREGALAAWALLSLGDDDELQRVPDELRAAVAHRRRLAAGSGRDIDEQLIAARYEWIDRHVAAATRNPTRASAWSERADAFLLHPVVGFAALILIMGFLFQTLFTWSEPLINWIDGGFGSASAWIMTAMPESALRSFFTEGLIAGTGAVLVFLPQIMLLFGLLGLMEDSGYMSRVAFLMDRIMRMVGLHGRAFIPMLSGYACAIPAVMATRTMERRRDRLLTMMVVPLMSCAARLPVYTLVIGALFPADEGTGWIDVQGLLLVGMYLFSTVIALIAAGVLSRTLIQGPSVPLILELPPYRLPQARVVGRMVFQKGKVFITEAGTVILACTVALWLLSDYPGLSAARAQPLDARLAALEETEPDPATRAVAAREIQRERGALQREYSWAGQLGRTIEPAIAPLGFDWKIGVGLIGSLAAREVFVATMAVVYGAGAEGEGATVSTLRRKMREEKRSDGEPVYTPLVGLSLLVFFALACQCLSTVAVVKRETGTWRWPLFMLGYMTVLAWAASFAVYQGGMALGYH